MSRRKMLSLCLIGSLLGITGCTEKLQGYDTDTVLKIYGNAELCDEDTIEAKRIAEQYAKCLFDVENGNVDEKQLEKLAPNESAKDWEDTYSSNQTESELKGFSVADIYTEKSEEIQCLTICEAEYSDWSTPKDIYLFIVRMDMKKSNDAWYIQSSDLTGTARKSEVKVVRDDFTGTIKFVTRGGETK